MTDSELMRLSEQVGLALKARGATVTTAESCTGGWRKPLPTSPEAPPGLNAALLPIVMKPKRR